MLKSKRDWKHIISIYVFLSFLIPILFLAYKIITTSNVIMPEGKEIRVRSDYILMFMQCLLGVFAMGLPSIISKKFKLEIPNTVFYFYLIFLYAAIVLGEIQKFYYRFKYWDLILHSLSSVMIGFIGFSIVDILNNENDNVQLNPFFIAFFSFCFAMALGSIWEVYEFLCDGFFNTNMQKYALETGIDLVGREALIDTCGDIIVDFIGALIGSTVGYISIKYKKNYLNSFIIKFKKDRKK